MTPVEHHAYETEYVGNSRGRAWLGEDWKKPQSRHVGVETRYLASRQVQIVDTELACLAQYVVIDVGDVPHALCLMAQIAQAPLQHVVGHIHRRVSDVCRVIGCDPTGVHRHYLTRGKRHYLSARGVI